MTKADTIIDEFIFQVNHYPRAVLDRLKVALGEAKFAALCVQLRALYDERVEQIRAAVPAISKDLPEGTLDDPMTKEV